MKKISTVYFDMDGVLVDFYRHLETLHQMTIDKLGETQEDPIGHMMDTHMHNKPFVTSPPTEEFKHLRALMHHLDELGVNVEILTSISNRHYNQDILEQKKVWLKEMGLDHYKVNFVTSSSQKGTYGHGEKMLIDDDEVSISSFNSQTGNGVLHDNWKDTYSQLVTYFPNFKVEVVENENDTKQKAKIKLG